MKTFLRTCSALALGVAALLAPESAAGIAPTVSTNALRFDGVDDFVQLGKADLPPPWTASMWVAREATMSPSSALLISDTAALKLDQFPSSGKVGFTRFNVVDHTFNYSTPLNVWTHLTFVATPSNTTLYVNGVFKEVINDSISLPMQSLSHPVKDPLKGYVDELSVWRGAWTAGEVRANYSVRAGGRERNLELLWHMDEVDGDIVKDSSRRRRNGVLSNGVARVSSGALLRNPLVVSNANDGGPGSLRHTLSNMTSGDIIRFSSRLSGRTIRLTTGPLLVNRMVTIDGAGLARGVTISGNNAGRVFTVNPGVPAFLHRLKITEGSIGGSFPESYGGGIFSQGILNLADCTLAGNRAFAGGALYNGGTMTLDGCTFLDNSASVGGAVQNEAQFVAHSSTFVGNSATVEGGAISAAFQDTTLNDCVLAGNAAGRGGAVHHGGTVTINRSVINANRTFDGAFQADSGAGGGISSVNGALTITRSLISSNVTGRGGDGGFGGAAGYGGGLFKSAGAATITDSTFVRNSTGAGGRGSGFDGLGGTGGDGGAIRVQDNASVLLRNSTLAGNRTGGGGYAGDGAAVSVRGTLTLVHATVSDNRTGESPNGGNGGGLWFGDGAILLTNSIVAGNVALADYDISGPFTAAASLVGGDVLLAPLGYYGGPTPTMLPLRGSPAIDAATAGLSADQRGYSRPAGSGPDIGAVEAQSYFEEAPFIVVGPLPQNAVVGQPFSLRVGAIGTESLRYQWSFQGRPLTGETNPVLTVANAQRGNAGSYRVAVQNDFGAAASRTARLRVIEPVVITAQPTNTTAALGSRVTLRVTATGTRPLRYQWQHHGTNVPGATRSSLTLRALTAEQSGPYRVLVQNAATAFHSAPALVTVAP